MCEPSGGPFSPSLCPVVLSGSRPCSLYAWLQDRPRASPASPFTVPALLSAFHCVLSAFREFARFPFLCSYRFHPEITGQERKSPFGLVFVRAVVSRCARRARPSEGRGVTCGSKAAVLAAVRGPWLFVL